MSCHGKHKIQSLALVLALRFQLVRITRQASDKFHMFRTDTFSLFLIHYSLMYSLINHLSEVTSIIVQ